MLIFHVYQQILKAFNLNFFNIKENKINRKLHFIILLKNRIHLNYNLIENQKYINNMKTNNHK